jgi:prepilin-type N-terminal cleavage/methylation domain-containing protein
MLRRSRFALANGFTIVEMLVVVGVIGVLVGLVVPTLAMFRAEARSTECLSNLRQLFVAVDTWRQQHQDSLPYAAPLPLPPGQQSFVVGLPERLKFIIKPEFSVWRCPSDNTDDSETLGTSYSYVAGAFMLLEPPLVFNDTHTIESDEARLERVTRLITLRYSSGYLRRLPLLADNGGYHLHGDRDPHNAVFIDGNARAVEQSDHQIAEAD